MLNLINSFNIRYVVSLVCFLMQMPFLCVYVCVTGDAVFKLYIYFYFSVYLILSLCIRFSIFGFVVVLFGCFGCLLMFSALIFRYNVFDFFILFALRLCVFLVLKHTQTCLNFYKIFAILQSISILCLL